MILRTARSEITHKHSNTEKTELNEVREKEMVRNETMQQAKNNRDKA